MKGKWFPTLCLVLLLFCLSYARFDQLGTKASSSLSVHNLNTGLNYSSIQAAIDANETLDGQTILVDDGTYYENVAVTKALSLVGENVNSTVVDGGGLGTVMTVAVDGVNVSGFTIQNSGSQWTQDFGVDLSSRKNCKIDGCIIRNEAYSVYVIAYAQNNTISDNIIANASSYPIMIQAYAQDNVVVNNTISGCDEGVHIEDSSDGNLVAYNSISDIGFEGVYVLSSNSNVIVNNEISSSGQGVPGLIYPAITLRDSSNNTASNNVIQNCTGGVMAHSIHNDAPAMYDVIENNIISNCDYAIILWHEEGSIPTYHEVTGNTLENNGYGLYIIGAKNNTVIHNSFINNSNGQASAQNLTNTWDDGYPSGGNFWSDYNGTDTFSGTYQNVSGSDGIGDTAYVTAAGNVTDRYPLIGMFSTFNVSLLNGQVDNVDVISNFTVSNLTLAIWLSSPYDGLQPGEPFIQFSATGESGSVGFCRLMIPKTVLNSSSYTVLVDEQPVNATELPVSNSTHVFLYFTYTQSTHQVIVTIPEFPPLILAIFMLATLLTIAIYSKRHSHS